MQKNNVQTILNLLDHLKLVEREIVNIQRDAEQLSNNDCDVLFKMKIRNHAEVVEENQLSVPGIKISGCQTPITPCSSIDAMVSESTALRLLNVLMEEFLARRREIIRQLRTHNVFFKDEPVQPKKQVVGIGDPAEDLKERIKFLLTELTPKGSNEQIINAQVSDVYNQVDKLREWACYSTANV